MLQQWHPATKAGSPGLSLHLEWALKDMDGKGHLFTKTNNTGLLKRMIRIATGEWTPWQIGNQEKLCIELTYMCFRNRHLLSQVRNILS